jgi:hypothetical protein
LERVLRAIMDINAHAFLLAVRPRLGHSARAEAVPLIGEGQN